MRKIRERKYVPKRKGTEDKRTILKKVSKLRKIKQRGRQS